MDHQDILLSDGGPVKVYKRGQAIIKDTGPWAPTVHSLLRHLESIGFDHAPQVVGSGFDPEGHEVLTYIDGEFAHPGPWTLEGAYAVGGILRELHIATASYKPPIDAVWRPWFGRGIGNGKRIISHCDVAPWNIVARNGLPVALIDWEYAGPVDPLVELAQACWLNAKLHDDIVAKQDGLPPLEERARHLRAIVDGYGLSIRQRRCFIDKIIEFVIFDTEEQANEAGVVSSSTHPEPDLLGFDPLWAMAWRARAAAWISRHRRILQNALC